MDTELWQILAHKCPSTVEFTIGNWFSTNRQSIVECKSIKDSSQQHVLTDERQMTVALKVWLCMSKILVDFAQTEDCEYRVRLHQDDETSDWNH